MQYHKIVFSHLDQNTSEILMAVLSELPFDSFEENEKQLFAFIKSKEYQREELLQQLNKFEMLKTLEFSEEVIPATNWNEIWESNFQPIEINERWSVRATFHNPLHTDQEIVINPKMSFGTGHHATTMMMMLLMSEMNFEKKKVFDFGAGTGILTIMASKLGADNIVAVDHEEWAYNNAFENYALNKCDNIKNIMGSIEDVKDQKFDIILANINKNVLIKSAATINESSYSDTFLLLSGILDEDQSEIISTFNAFSFKEVEVKSFNNWCAIKFIKL